MLEELKRNYEANANLISDWKSLDRSTLCRLYVQYKSDNNPIADNYLSAIICKFWNLINHNYINQGKKVATEQDCYDWVIESILYVLDHHVWDNENSSLYNDPNGPEKAINVKIISLRNNFFEFVKKQKRAIDYNTISLEELSEESSDDYYVGYTPAQKDDYLKNKITDYFNKKDYFPAFMLDCIITGPVFTTNEYGQLELNFKKLKKLIKNLSETYCNYFANMYNLSLEQVLNSRKYILNIDSNTMDYKISQNLLTWSRDKQLIRYLKD